MELDRLEPEDICSGSKWKVRISQEFMKTAEALSESELLSYITAIKMLAEGKWPGPSNSMGRLRVVPLEFSASLPYSGFFLFIVPESPNNPELRMLFSVGVERLVDTCQHSLIVWSIPSKEEKSVTISEAMLGKYWG